MNYKAELRGFALDRAIRIAELSDDAVNYAGIVNTAEDIVEYLYIPDKDIKSHLETIVPLIIKGGDIEKLDGLILELQQIRAEMDADIKRSN